MPEKENTLGGVLDAATQPIRPRAFPAVTEVT